jgi:hypothetical protein
VVMNLQVQWKWVIWPPERLSYPQGLCSMEFLNGKI